MDPIELTKTEKQYLSDELDKVSRSFALVIPTLEEPLNYQMGIAYLICRVVDNIEDCTQPLEWKALRFQEFHGLINEPAAAAQILTRWSRESWPGLTPDETAMMGERSGSMLWGIFASLPETVQSIIRHWSAEMANGMAIIEGPDRDVMSQEYDGILVLSEPADYNEYCFYVAGTVGHMATELAVRHYGLSDEIADQLIAGSESCGRGLQKTNILKDFAGDVGRGISYLPYVWHQEIDFTSLKLTGAPIEWTRKVLDDVVQELREATAYLLTLPYEASGYRMASLMSLLPAYQTLLLAAKKHDLLFTPKHQVKISRSTMMKCKWDAKSLLNNNDGVRKYSERLEREIAQALAS